MAAALAGILWVGSVMYAVAILLPTLRALPASGVDVVRSLEIRRRPAVTGSGGIAVALGFLRGLLGGELGPSAYGATFGASLVLALALLAWSQFVIVPATEDYIGSGSDTSRSRLRRSHVLGLAGFYLLVGLMVAMGFGA